MIENQSIVCKTVFDNINHWLIFEENLLLQKTTINFRTID